jgi:hypothetical protein
MISSPSACATTGHRDQGRGAVFAAPVLYQSANVGIDLLGRLFADVACVEHDQIGLLAFGGGGDALVGQQFFHALTVIDVHLTAEAFDAIGAGRGNR